MKEVLVESGEEEDLVALERAANGASDVRLRGSCATPGEKSARSEKRRPLRGKSLTARSSSSVETALGWVSTRVGAAETVTFSSAFATLR
jgi:hypothetical protein